MKIEATNPWGAAGGEDTQRADLWIIDFSNVVAAFNLPLERSWFYVKSVTLPTLETAADVYRRNNSPRFFPGLDTAPGPIAMEFQHDIGPELKSKIYNFLNRWRARVRTGRGPFSREPQEYLPKNYQFLFKFDVILYFLKNDGAGGTVDSMSYKLVGLWLSSLGIGPLDYGRSEGSQINATFYADDILELGPSIIVRDLTTMTA